MGNHKDCPYTESADITADWDAPARVWEQFCAEINIVHVPIADPVAQGRLMP